MARVTVTECPNCGGPIDPKVASRSDDPTCPFCHHALPTEPDPQAARPFTLGTNSDIAVFDASAPRATKGGRATALIVALFVALVIGGVVAGVVVFGRSSTTGLRGSSGGGGYSTANSVVVPVAAGMAGDFYVVAPSTGATESEVVRRVHPSGTKASVVWSSGVLDQSDAGVPVVVAGPSQAFAIFGTTVVALDAATGQRRWQASLSNRLARPCTSRCAVAAAGRLVTLAEDGTVQAFDATSGAQSWSVRLASTPRWLEAAGDNVLVDEAAARGPDLSILVLSAATGTARRLAPSCPAGSDIPINAGARDEDGLFVSPDGTALTVLVTTSGGCALRYRLADGAMLWRTATDEFNHQIPFTLTGESVVQSASTLAWTNHQSAFALDTATGAIRKLFDIPRSTTLSLSGIAGSTLFVESALQSDSDRRATVAYDLGSGKQLWQVATRVTRSGDTQALALTATNPVIVSCNSTSDTCLFEAVDAATGTIKGSSTLPAEPGQVDEVNATATNTSLEVVVGWNHIVGLDPATAAVQWRWPN